MNTKKYIIQSISINKHYLDIDEAIKEVLKFGLKVKKIHETKHYYKFRQHDPNLLKNHGFNKIRTKYINDFIYLTIFY